MPKLTEAGVNVVAITAEPGGEKAVRQRLLERKVPTLDFEIRSDPSHEFLQNPNMPKHLFILQDKEWEVSGPYKMVQPALLVHDADGNLVEECSWSWRTMGLGPDVTWDTRVTTQAWAGPIKQVQLVTMRPVMSDLVSSIEEKRPVKLASTHDHW